MQVVERTTAGYSVGGGTSEEIDVDTREEEVKLEATNVEQEKKVLKATKEDDADVPEYLWDNWLARKFPELPRNKLTMPCLNLIQTFCLRWWCQYILHTFVLWY